MLSPRQATRDKLTTSILLAWFAVKTGIRLNTITIIAAQAATITIVFLFGSIAKFFGTNGLLTMIETKKVDYIDVFVLYGFQEKNMVLPKYNKIRSVYDEAIMSLTCSFFRNNTLLDVF